MVLCQLLTLALDFLSCQRQIIPVLPQCFWWLRWSGLASPVTHGRRSYRSGGDDLCSPCFYHRGVCHGCGGTVRVWGPRSRLLFYLLYVRENHARGLAYELSSSRSFWRQSLVNPTLRSLKSGWGIKCFFRYRLH